jgi:hypothetical protein
VKESSREVKLVIRGASNFGVLQQHALTLNWRTSKVLQNILKMATAKPEDLYPVFLDFLEKFKLKKTLKAIKAEFSEQVKITCCFHSRLCSRHILGFWRTINGIDFSLLVLDLAIILESIIVAWDRGSGKYQRFLSP